METLEDDCIVDGNNSSITNGFENIIWQLSLGDCLLLFV